VGHLAERRDEQQVALDDRFRHLEEQRSSLGEVCSDVIDWAGTVDGDRASKPKLQALTPQRSGEAGR